MASSSTRARLALRLLAPYLAVGVFWYGFSSGWPAILAYHAQILFWARRDGALRLRPWSRRSLIMALPAAAAGPLVFVLLPHMLRTDLASWLLEYGLGGPAFLAMVPYFGLVHPVLEQVHWAPLRDGTRWAHPAFAGYHVLVLWSLLSWPWVLACFVVLAGVSFLWGETAKRSGSLAAPMLMHVLADTGIVLAVLLLV